METRDVPDVHEVDALYDQISSQPVDEEQLTFCLVWDAATLIGCGGFEPLFEQTATIEEYGAAFARIGMPEAEGFFAQIAATVPSDLRAGGRENELLQHLASRFEELKNLSYEFYEVTSAWPAALLRYVHAHQEHFPSV